MQFNLRIIAFLLFISSSLAFKGLEFPVPNEYPEDFKDSKSVLTLSTDPEALKHPIDFKVNGTLLMTIPPALRVLKDNNKLEDFFQYKQDGILGKFNLIWPKGAIESVGAYSFYLVDCTLIQQCKQLKVPFNFYVEIAKKKLGEECQKDFECNLVAGEAHCNNKTCTCKPNAYEYITLNANGDKTTMCNKKIESPGLECHDSPNQCDSNRGLSCQMKEKDKMTKYECLCSDSGKAFGFGKNTCVDTGCKEDKECTDRGLVNYHCKNKKCECDEKYFKTECGCFNGTAINSKCNYLLIAIISLIALLYKNK